MQNIRNLIDKDKVSTYLTFNYYNVNSEQIFKTSNRNELNNRKKI